MSTSKPTFPLPNGDTNEQTVEPSPSTTRSSGASLLFQEGHQRHLEALLSPTSAAPMASAVDAALFQQLRGRRRS